MMFKLNRAKRQGIRLSIFGRLLIGIITIQMLILSIAFVGLTSIKELERSSKLIVEESNDQYKIHNLKLLLSQLLMPVNDYLIHGNLNEIEQYHILLEEVKSQLYLCLEVIEYNSQYQLLTGVSDDLNKIQKLADNIFEFENPIQNFEAAVMMERMDLIAEDQIEVIDQLLVNNLAEIELQVEKSQVTNSRAPRIIIITGLFTVISLLVGGFVYVKEITRPIKQILQTTERISSGDLTAKAEIKSITKDELEELVNSFNNMVGVVEKKTVPKDYFQNILARMVDSLIISDKNDDIRFVNQACLELLGYTEEELIGQPLTLIIKNDRPEETHERTNVDNIINNYYSKEDKSIPVSFSKSIMYDVDSKFSGMICLAFGRVESKCTKMQDLQAANGNESRNINTVGKSPLTTRESEILRLIAHGGSNSEIADNLSISTRTVETHRRNLMEKLNAKSVIPLVHYAVQNGII